MISRLFKRYARPQAPLLGRSEDEHAAAEISTESGEFTEIGDRSLPHGGVGIRHMKPRRLGQEPVEPHALEPGGLKRATEVGPLSRRHLGGEWCQCERGDLEARIAACRGVIAGFCERPVAIGFIADGIAHNRKDRRRHHASASVGRVIRGERGGGRCRSQLGELSREPPTPPQINVRQAIVFGMAGVAPVEASFPTCRIQVAPFTGLSFSRRREPVCLVPPCRSRFTFYLCEFDHGPH